MRDSNERPPFLRQRKVIGPEVLRAMLAVVIRNTAVFDEVRVQLRPELVAASDAGLGILYRLVDKYYEEFEGLPSADVLCAEFHQAVDGVGAGLSDPEIDDVDDFIDFAYDEGRINVTDERQAKWALKKVRQFLQERLADDIRDSVGGIDTVSSDVPLLLQSLQTRADEIVSLASDAPPPIFADGWDEQVKLDLRPTGVSFLDDYLRGGQAPREPYVVMAPYGTCKTLLAVQCVVETARWAYAQSKESNWDGRRGLAFYVSYEAGLAEFRQRLLVYAAQVHKDSVEAMTNMSSLSTSDSLKEYELKLFADQLRRGVKPLGERERAASVTQVLNDHIVFIDMLGSTPASRGKGTGYIQEIATEVTAVCRKLKNVYPATVWIDYAGAAAKRHIRAGHAKQEALRNLISEVPLMAQASIGAPWDCPVWICHQLSGAAQSSAPGRVLHHSDSAESKSIGENAVACFVFGNKTEEGLVAVNCSKQRRNQLMPPRVVRIEGEFGRVVDTRGEYLLDSAQRKIVAKSDSNRINRPPRRFGGSSDLE